MGRFDRDDARFARAAAESARSGNPPGEVTTAGEGYDGYARMAEAVLEDAPPTRVSVIPPPPPSVVIMVAGITGRDEFLRQAAAGRIQLTYRYGTSDKAYVAAFNGDNSTIMWGRRGATNPQHKDVPWYVAVQKAAAKFCEGYQVADLDPFGRAGHR